jgi:chromosome segregation ATPase
MMMAAEREEGGDSEQQAAFNDRLLRRLMSLQSSRQALEGLGAELEEARRDRVRLQELEEANDALERRVAHLLLDRANAHKERERVESIAMGLEQLKAAAGAQQQRLFEAQAELARLEGIEAEATQVKEALGLLVEEREGLLQEVRALHGEQAACSEHAEACVTTLVRLAARSRSPPGGRSSTNDSNRDEEEEGEGSQQAEATALLETFFSTRQGYGSGSVSGGLWASLRGIVEETGRLLVTQRRAEARAAAAERREAAAAERAAQAEEEKETLLARAEDAESRLAQLGGDWEEARAAARALEPMVASLRDSLLRAETKAAELGEEVAGRDRFLLHVLQHLQTLTGEGEGEGEEGGHGALGIEAAANGGTGEGGGGDNAAAAAEVDFMELQYAVSAALAAVAERRRALHEHHGRAAGESQRREAELQQLARDFRELSAEHREAAGRLAKWEREGEGLGAVIRRQEEELEARAKRLAAAEAEARELGGRLAGVVGEKGALEEALAWAQAALKEERAQGRQRREELEGWQRYAQRCQQEVADVQRSLHQGLAAAGGGPVLVAAGGLGSRSHPSSPARGLFRASSRF